MILLQTILRKHLRKIDYFSRNRSRHVEISKHLVRGNKTVFFMRRHFQTIRLIDTL